MGMGSQMGEPPGMLEPTGISSTYSRHPSRMSGFGASRPSGIGRPSGMGRMSGISRRSEYPGGIRGMPSEEAVPYLSCLPCCSQPAEPPREPAPFPSGSSPYSNSSNSSNRGRYADSNSSNRVNSNERTGSLQCQVICLHDPSIIRITSSTMAAAKVAGLGRYTLNAQICKQTYT